MCHKNSGFENAPLTRQSVFTKTQNPGKLLFSIASVTSLRNTSSHLKMAVLWRKPFSRQQIAFLNTSKIEHRSWKPLKKWNSPALQGKRKNGYVCGGATEEVHRPVWVPFPPLWRVNWYSVTMASFHQDGFWRHERQRKSTHLFAMTYQRKEYFWCCCGLR